jgi:hypothetical protein
MKRILLSVVLIALLTTVSCLKRGSYSYNYENNSSHDLELTVILDGDTSVFQALKQSEMRFYMNSGIGVEVPDANYFLEHVFDTLYFNINDTLGLHKDWYDYTNWVHMYEGTNADHTFVIEDADIW